MLVGLGLCRKRLFYRLSYRRCTYVRVCTHAILIITGGAIAYIGDRIECALTEEAYPVWASKYTSIVITIITGILIAGAQTVLVLYRLMYCTFQDE